MLQTFKNGQGSIVLRAKLLDSSSTTGAGLTGLSSASSSLIISTIADNEATATAYTQAGSTIESISTLGTFAAPTATKCRFKEVDSTNHKGVYEFQFADARFAVSSAKSLLVSVLGATNLQQADFVVQLQSDDPYVTKLTAAAVATGVWQDTTAGDFTTALSVGKSLMNGVSLGTGLTVNDLTTKTGFSLSVTPPTSAAIATAVWGDTTAGDFTVSASVGKSVMNGVALGTGLTVAAVTARVTANADQLAGQTITAASGVTFPSSVASPTNITAGTITTVTNLTNAPTVGDLTSAMKASVNAEADTALADYDAPTHTELTAELATADDAVLAQVALVKAKTDLIPASPAAVGSAMTLTAAYDAAKTAATQTSVDDLPTNAELATSQAAADDATLAAVAALNNLSAAQVNAEVDTALADYDAPTHAELTAELATADDATLAAIAALNNLSAAQVNTEVDSALADVGVTTTVTGRIDAAVTTRMAAYTQPTGFLAATFPSDPADQSLVIAATDALAALIGDVPTNAELTTALGTADDAVLAQVALVKADTAAIKLQTDKFVFTVANQVDSNVQYINDVQIAGGGVEDTDEWRPV